MLGASRRNRIHSVDINLCKDIIHKSVYTLQSMARKTRTERINVGGGREGWLDGEEGRFRQKRRHTSMISTLPVYLFSLCMLLQCFDQGKTCFVH